MTCSTQFVVTWLKFNHAYTIYSHLNENLAEKKLQYTALLQGQVTHVVFCKYSCINKHGIWDGEQLLSSP
jgi:hypothetical protein